MSAEIIDETKRGHWPSASGMVRTKNCTASFQASLPFIDQPEEPSEDALRGQRIHAEVAHRLEGGDPRPMKDKEESATFKLLLQVEDLEQKHFPGADPRPAMIVEQRMWNGETPAYSGQGDVVFFDNNTKRALVIDYKTGWGDYDPSDANLQLATLAVLCALEYGATEVGVALMRPDRETVIAIYDQAMLARAKHEIDDIVAEAVMKLDGPPQFNPGDWCKYCPALPHCDAARDTMIATADRILLLRDIKEIPAENLNVMMRHAKSAEQVIKAVKEEMKRRIAIGAPGLAYALKPGAKMPSIEDLPAAFKTVAGEMTVNEFLGCCEVSITALRDLVRKKDGSTEDAAKKKVDMLLGGAVTYTPKAASLVEANKLQAPKK